MSESTHNPYAAAEGREFLRGELKDKPNEWVREFAGLINDDETLDLLNYYCSLWADVGENFLDERMAKVIMRNASTRAINRAYEDGNVSMMKGMTGLTSQDTADGKDLYSEAARRLEMEGTIGLMFGAPGAGKTATTIDIAITWRARTGGALIGNTEWTGFDATFNTDREMLELMASIKGPVLALIDEVAQELSGFGSGNVEAEAFSNSLLYIRKLEQEYGDYPKKGSVLATAHTRKKTAKCIREVASFGINKMDRANPDKARLLESESDSDEWEAVQTYQGLTDTSENYSEYDASDFQILEGLDDEDGDDPAENVEDIEKRKEIETAIRGCLRGDSQEDVAELTSYGRGWVGNMWRDWKKGEYRDLVALPETLPDHVAEEDVVRA